MRYAPPFIASSEKAEEAEGIAIGIDEHADSARTAKAKVNLFN
jgi:hypothetical protein